MIGLLLKTLVTLPFLIHRVALQPMIDWPAITLSRTIFRKPCLRVPKADTPTSPLA